MTENASGDARPGAPTQDREPAAQLGRRADRVFVRVFAIGCLVAVALALVLSPGARAADPRGRLEYALWISLGGAAVAAAFVRARREIARSALRHADLATDAGRHETRPAEVDEARSATEASAEGVARFDALVRDVTEARNAREELQHAKDAAESANSAKSEFLANISHEVRTPVTAILGYADLLLDAEASAADRTDYIQTIRRNSEHLLSVLNNILDLSKIEADKMTVEAVACSPGGIAQDVCSLMRVRAREKNLALDVASLTPIPETIHTDPTRLRQVLINLVGNAIKFTEAGSVRVLIRYTGAYSLAPRLSFSVVDTGVGITPEHLSRLYQPFTQADTSTTRKFGGTGLGLAICRRLAKMLGGDVVIESEPGKGTVATLTIDPGGASEPGMLDQLGESCTSAGVRMPQSIAPTATVTGAVLLAEDGEDNQRLLAAILRKAGATVTIVENGRAAVDAVAAAAAQGAPFDVVLMDMQMPLLDGYGATRLLRAEGYRGQIIALTAHAMSGDRERCLAAGCDEYLVKPINRARLISTVAERIAHSAKSAASIAPPGSPAQASTVIPAEAVTEPPPEAPPEALVSEFADDEEMAGLLAQFVSGLPERAARIADAFRRGDDEALRRFAHQLMGAAGGYGFSPISAAASRVEQAAMGEPGAGQLGSEVDALLALCARARGPRGDTSAAQW